MTEKPTTSETDISELLGSTINTGHISIGIMSALTGKQGVRHLYSDEYRERWPQDQYPEKYEEDIPVN